MQTRGVIESVVFSVANTFIMVCGMLAFNLWIHDCLGVKMFLVSFLPIAVVAFAINFFIVAPLIKAAALRFHIEKYIPFMMPFAMAGLMTFIAPIIEVGRTPAFGEYIIAFPRNYIAAFLLQSLVAMRFAIYVLTHFRVRFISH